jgi:hypothetical protein
VSFDEWDECVLDGGCDRYPTTRAGAREAAGDRRWKDAQRYGRG